MDILAIASFAGAHYLRVFAKKKLGFVRWLNFNGAKLSESIPFDTLKFVMLILILALAAGAGFFAYRHRKSIGLNGIIMCAAMLFAVAYCVYATKVCDYSYSQAYFLILPVLWLGTVFLAVRNFILPPADSASEK